MDEINAKYKELAAELGHLQFQMELLKLKQEPILAKIHELNSAVEVLKQYKAKQSADKGPKNEPPKAEETSNPQN